LIGSCDRVRDLRDQDTEEIAGKGADLKIVIDHRQDPVPARLIEPGVHREAYDSDLEFTAPTLSFEDLRLVGLADHTPVFLIATATAAYVCCES
jgi:hypothetical protein